MIYIYALFYKKHRRGKISVLPPTNSATNNIIKNIYVPLINFGIHTQLKFSQY